MTNQRQFDLVLQSVRDDRRPSSAGHAHLAKRDMWVIHLALSLAALYAAIIAGMYCPNLAPFSRLFSPGRRGFTFPNHAALKVRTPDGESLVGLRIPGMGVKTTARHHC